MMMVMFGPIKNNGGEEVVALAPLPHERYGRCGSRAKSISEKIAMMALFAEMYGFPLTIYLLSGWLSARFPGVNLFGHDAGHLWWLLSGQHGDPHFGAVHIATLLSASWQVLYHAQRRHEVAVTGPYRWVRHPQYIGFVAIMFGFLLQWPTLVTLVMFPVLVVMYVRLAIREEHDSERKFEADWRAYASATPRFVPRWVEIRHPGNPDEHSHGTSL